MQLTEKLFPRQADNQYNGSPIAFYVLCFFAIVFSVRSLIHYLKADSGVNSIASIISFSGTPDPNTVIYLYSALWGSQQLLTVCILGVVLWRYRTLIPLMYLMLIAEQLLRLSMKLLHPLTPDYFEHTPPGAVANLPVLAVAMVMLFLSLRTNSVKP